MAQADHLPIFKACYDLCLYLEQVVERFSRSHRFGLGSEIRASARRALGLVVRANSRDDKVPLLLELREEIESLKVQLRLCHDVKAFASFRSFEHAVTKAVPPLEGRLSPGKIDRTLLTGRERRAPTSFSYASRVGRSPQQPKAAQLSGLPGRLPAS